jgi:hypothetical protein
MMLSFVGSAGTMYEQQWRYWRLAEGEHLETSLPGIDGDWGWDVGFKNAFPNAAEHGVDLLDGEATNRSTGEAAKRPLDHRGLLHSTPHRRPRRRPARASTPGRADHGLVRTTPLTGRPV